MHNVCSFSLMPKIIHEKERKSNMKKIVTILMVVLLVFGAVACKPAAAPAAAPAAEATATEPAGTSRVTTAPAASVGPSSPSVAALGYFSSTKA